MFCVRSTLAATLFAATAAAQDPAPPPPPPPPPDTTSFRSGQWAMQFGGGLNLATLGLLKFTGPARAWLVDLAVDGGHQHSTIHATSPTDTTLSSYSSHATVTLRLGRRFYRARSGRVVTFQTLGVLGGFGHSAGSGFFGGGGSTNGWSAGAFGEIGAAFLVASKLSVGGTAGATWTYARSVSRSSTERQVSWSYQGSGPAARFVTTIYF